MTPIDIQVSRSVSKVKPILYMSDKGGGGISVLQTSIFYYLDWNWFWFWPAYRKRFQHCCLASCQVSLNSVQRSLRSQNQRPGPSFFPICPKNTNMVEGVEILLLVKFCWISFSSFREEDKMSQPIRGQGCHLIFPICPKNTNLVEDVEILLPVKFC